MRLEDKCGGDVTEKKDTRYKVTPLVRSERRHPRVCYPIPRRLISDKYGPCPEV